MIWSTSFIPSIPSDRESSTAKRNCQQLGEVIHVLMHWFPGSLAPRSIPPRPRNTRPCASPSSGRCPGLKNVDKMPWWCLALALWWCHEIDKIPWWCLLVAPWWRHWNHKIPWWCLGCRDGVHCMISSVQLSTWCPLTLQFMSDVDKTIGLSVNSKILLFFHMHLGTSETKRKGPNT